MFNYDVLTSTAKRQCVLQVLCLGLEKLDALSRNHYRVPPALNANTC